MSTFHIALIAENHDFSYVDNDISSQEAAIFASHTSAAVVFASLNKLLYWVGNKVIKLFSV